jgi:hypothetical protein
MSRYRARCRASSPPSSGTPAVRLIEIGLSGPIAATFLTTAGPLDTDSEGQPVMSIWSSLIPRWSRLLRVTSPRTPMLADRSRTARRNRRMCSDPWGRALDPSSSSRSCAPTPTTTTGMLRPSMTRVRLSRFRVNPRRNALAIGRTKASNSSSRRAMSLSENPSRCAPNPSATISVPGLLRIRWTALENRALPEFMPSTFLASVSSGPDTANGSFPALSRMRGTSAPNGDRAGNPKDRTGHGRRCAAGFVGGQHGSRPVTSDELACRACPFRRPRPPTRSS